MHLNWRERGNRHSNPSSTEKCGQGECTLKAEVRRINTCQLERDQENAEETDYLVQLLCFLLRPFDKSSMTHWTSVALRGI